MCVCAYIYKHTHTACEIVSLQSCRSANLPVCEIKIRHVGGEFALCVYVCVCGSMFVVPYVQLWSMGHVEKQKDREKDRRGRNDENGAAVNSNSSI